MNDRIGVHRIDVAAHVLCGRRDHHTHGHFGESAHLLCQRQRIQRRTGYHFGLRCVLHVDDWALTGDGQGFFERADAHFSVDFCGKCAGQLDLITLDRAETGQREGHGIDARPEVDDLVFTVLVREDGADFLNERVAGGFDGHARHYRTRGISHRAGDSSWQRLSG